MTENRSSESPAESYDPRGQVMKTPEDVEELLRLKACGWGVKRIGRALGCRRHTVRRYLEVGGFAPFKALAGSSTHVAPRLPPMALAEFTKRADNPTIAGR